jgi:hypothetical protein
MPLPVALAVNGRRSTSSRLRSELELNILSYAAVPQWRGSANGRTTLAGNGSAISTSVYVSQILDIDDSDSETRTREFVILAPR